MSFILDALKKSESDRQRKTAPDISDVPTGVSPSGTPRWLWLLSGLLAVNLMVLLVVLLKPSPVANPASSAAPDPSQPPAELATTESAPLADEPLEPAATRTASAPPTASPAVQPVPAGRTESPAAAPMASEPPPAETETYLTFNDLRASGSVSLPDLHIDLHVYSDDPTERFVFINMNQYRENSTLSEGPRLRRITTEGVILEYVGTTFLLPRE